MDLVLEHDREKELQQKWGEVLQQVAHVHFHEYHRRVLLFGFLIGAGVHESLARHIADDAPENGWKLNL